jgi:GDPmannose 4,6-dehydratase
MKVALITGVNGQDGFYLSELLLGKGYIVHGLRRRSTNNIALDKLYADPRYAGKFILHYSSLNDTSNLVRLIHEVQPDEIYNLAAQSHVKISFDSPEYTADSDAIGVLRLLEGIRILQLQNKTRFYQASTSELFGKVQEIPQKETTPFYPRSPYGVAKLYAYWITVNYRESYNLFAVNGILFNHESPLRGENYVTRKITIEVAKIALGLSEELFLGNLNAGRDWGHAKDYVYGMWLMMQQEKPEDYVLATGVTNTVRDFIKIAFSVLGIEINFSGSGVDEKGFITRCSNPDYQLPLDKVVVKVNPSFFRATEVDYVIGDATKAKKKLGWEPQYNLEMIIREMVKSDIDILKSGPKLLSVD